MRQPEDVPLTTGTLLRWGGIAFTAVSAIVSAVLYASAIRSDTALLRKDVDANTQAIHQVDVLSQQRNDAQEKEIDALKTKQDASDRALVEVQRKLDVVVALLERIDRRTGGDSPKP